MANPENIIDSKNYKLSKEELVWILYKLINQYPNETVKVNGKDQDSFLDQIKIRKIERKFT